jgi:cysteinyl-tRNA synthetase
MHNGMIRMAEEKMSKSEGNIFQLSEALDHFGPEAVVAYLVSGHYRQPLEFSEGALEQAAAGVERIRDFVRSLEGHEPADEEGVDPFVAARREAFLDALADDFNTPRALAAVFALVKEGNRRPLPGAAEALAELLPLLGLEAVLRPEEGPGAEAQELLAEREGARAERDFERADRIRDQLAALGWEVRDEAGGARLVKSR